MHRKSKSINLKKNYIRFTYFMFYLVKVFKIVYMVYGELGHHRLNIRVQLRMISLWCKLIQNQNKLSGILYKLMFNLQTNDD